LADYQKMYATLFHAVTDAIELLQAAQRAAEELFISAKEPEVRILQKPAAEHGGADRT